jgi:amino acid transporter
VSDLEVVLYGDSRIGVEGLVHLVKEMNNERNRLKAILTGVAIGLAFNGVISVATLLQLLGG